MRRPRNSEQDPCYSFSEMIVQFLNALNTKRKRVNHFVKTPFSTKTINTAIIGISLREHQLNNGVINLKHFHQNTVYICFGFMRPYSNV